MQIAILVFEKLTALDAIGPYEVLRSVPGWEVRFVGPQKGMVRTDSGALGLSADYSLDEVTEPDVLLVPGDPQPPFDAGSPSKAPTPVVEVVTAAAGSSDEWLGARASD